METTNPSEYRIINAEHIVDPPKPNRIEITQDELQDLANSIKQIGLKEPLIVRPVGDKFEIVAGHRRFKACLMAGVINIRCIVENLTDDQAEDVKAHENLFRQDLNPLEEAVALSRVVAKDRSNLGEIAQRLRKSEEWILSRLEILNYPEYFWPALESGELKLSVAKYLAAIEDEVYRRMYFDSATANGMKAWQAEVVYRQWKAGILAPSEAIMPDKNSAPATAIPSYKTVCEKCGKMGETPNLRTVWIHLACPADSAAPSA